VSGAIDVHGRKRVLIIASNPATSPTTGWPIGFWWSELTHPYWEFTEHGYDVDVASPDGGDLVADSWSDPRDESRYSEDDVLSLGFLSSPKHSALTRQTPSLEQVDLDGYAAVLFIGGQAPMVTFYDNERVHRAATSVYEAGKILGVICHGTCMLLKARLSSGELLVRDKTWTGFANSEEAYADEFVGRPIQPFHIEDEARRLPDTNFVVSGRFRSFAVRDGNLVTGQQQYSGAAAARLIIQALGV
jgi:putative intracellular protease/amidase